MPSSGKSTLGRKLARALNYRFVDLDKLIVKDQKKTIPELFKENGEAYFREVESRSAAPNPAQSVAGDGYGRRGTLLFRQYGLYKIERNKRVY